MIYVHLGAGAGDKDEGALFRCGFTEFIKKRFIGIMRCWFYVNILQLNKYIIK